MSPIPIPFPSTLYIYCGMLVAALLIIWRGKLNFQQAGRRCVGWHTPLQGLGWGGLLAVLNLSWLIYLLQTGRYLPIPIIPAPVDWIMLAVVMPGIEELFFRGAIFSSLQRSWSLFWALFLSASFSVVCLPMQGLLALIFLNSIGYALSFRLARSIVAPMIAHVLVAFVLLVGRMYPGMVGRLEMKELLPVGGTALAIILSGIISSRAYKVTSARR